MLSTVDELTAEDRQRAKLERFIARSGRVKRNAVRLGAGLALAAISLHFAGAAGGLALGALLLGALIAAAGVWISGGHIRDFEGQLRALDARRRRG
jgi:hypothetical protein